jgi:hypothetical protein
MHDHHASVAIETPAPQPSGDHPSAQSLHVNAGTSNSNPSQLERGVHRDPGEVATSVRGHDGEVATSVHGHDGEVATSMRGHDVTATSRASFHRHNEAARKNNNDDGHGGGHGRGEVAPSSLQGGAILHSHNEVGNDTYIARGRGGPGGREAPALLQAEGKGEGESEGEGATTQQLMDLLGSDSEDSVVSVDSFGEPYDATVGIMQRRVTAVRFHFQILSPFVFPFCFIVSLHICARLKRLYVLLSEHVSQAGTQTVGQEPV